MHETLQPGQVHDLYHEAYMALLTFQIEDLTEKIGAITTAGGTRPACTYSFARNLVWKSLCLPCMCVYHLADAGCDVRLHQNVRPVVSVEWPG